jgi:probable HAF family extracellular repeat protein
MNTSSVGAFCMSVNKSLVIIALGQVIGWSALVGPALGDPMGSCCYPQSPYGEGSSPPEDCDITVDTVLDHNLDCVDLHVHPGVVLDTAGHVLRACDTLLNEGTITDSQSGGVTFGSGGGQRQDPCENSGGPEWPEDGSCTYAGIPPFYPEAGEGGACGCSGAGGGGAKWQDGACIDADGGDGGRAGNGGRGGGYVQVYACNLDNQGVIHADGGEAEEGEAGGDGEYTSFDDPPKDFAGGGGGGGAGGGGGDGGTVELYYANIISLNESGIHADGGPGGAGGLGGLSGTSVVGHYLLYPDDWYEESYEGAQGQPPPPAEWRSGDGGDGEHYQFQYAEDGEPGTAGPEGEAGDVLLTYLPCPPVYTITDLGPGSGLDSYAEGINNFTEIVGYADTPTGNLHAFRWAAGTMYDLGTLGGDSSRAYDINNLGQVVGGSETDPGDEASQAFLWLPYPFQCHGALYPPGMKNLGMWLGHAYSSANAINDSTVVTGWWSDAVGLSSRAFVWFCEADCGLPTGDTDILPPASSWTCESWEGTAINEFTDVAVLGLWSSSRESVKAGSWKEYCSSGGCAWCQPNGLGFHDLNDLGVTVGYRQVGLFGSAPVIMGFDGGCDDVELPNLIGGIRAAALAVNDGNDVVGWSRDDALVQRACFWQHDAELGWLVYDLNELLLPAPDWIRLVEATDINDGGKIVGYGIRADGDTHAFLLTPFTMGACCLQDQTCVELPGGEDVCHEWGGVYQGDDTGCADADCTMGACCLGQDECLEASAEECSGFAAICNFDIWGNEPKCFGDGNGDNAVTPQDVGLIKFNYGSVSEEALCRWDLNCDGTIDPADVGLAKFNYAAACGAQPPLHLAPPDDPNHCPLYYAPGSSSGWYGYGTACDMGCQPVTCNCICPDGAIYECSEACGYDQQDCNGGCDEDPPVFDVISAGDTVCGTTMIQKDPQEPGSHQRDRDWFAFTTTDEETYVTFSVHSDFVSEISLREADCEQGAGRTQLGGGGDCGLNGFSACVGAGDWYISVAPALAANGYALPCTPEINRYYATLTFSECPTGACCLAGDCILTGTILECSDAGGEYWFEGEDCFGAPPFECPVP